MASADTTTTRQAGTIKTIVEQRGFGFIARDSAKDLFFHCKDLDQALSFDESLRDLPVTFVVLESAKGLKAVAVWPAD